MRHVSPPLAELTAHAQTLTSAGDLAGARALLADVLDPADADPQRASPDLALAAALQARILTALGDPHAARTWAGFAHAAEERLHGPHDERTIAAAATHAAVLHGVGNHGRAAQLYHDLVGELTALDGRLSPRVLAAEADLATAEHAAGHCTAARVRLSDVWIRHREVYGDASAAGIKMLARLGAMERECGRNGDAQEHLMQAQELCARYLPADHPLAQQIARLAGADVSGRHVCGRVQRSVGPTSGGPAPGVTRVPATTPGVHPVRREPLAPGDVTGRHARSEPPITLPQTSPAPPQPVPHQPVPHQPIPGQAAQDHSGQAIHQPPQAGQPTDAAFIQSTLIQAALTQAAPGQDAPTALSQAEPGHDTPTALSQAGPVQDAQTAPAQGAPAYQPSPQEWTGQPPGPWPPDSPPPAAYAPDAYPPGPRLSRQPVDRATARVIDRRLPVPVAKPDPHSSKHALLLAAVLVAGIAAAAAIVAATLPRGDAGPAAAPEASTQPTSAPFSAAPSSAPPTNAAVAPAGVTLQDNRDSVALTWRYPKGSEGPVLISGGRAGQEKRAFQQLPAGTTEYGGYAQARADLSAVEALGIPYDEVVQQLEDEGVAKFEAAWQELLRAVSTSLSTKGVEGA
jgi:hypothetical protein